RVHRTRAEGARKTLALRVGNRYTDANEEGQQPKPQESRISAGRLCHHWRRGRAGKQTPNVCRIVCAIPAAHVFKLVWDWTTRADGFCPKVVTTGMHLRLQDERAVSLAAHGV